MVMPVGLTYASTTFQKVVNSVFYDILDEYLTIYLDDLLVYSSKEEEYEKHLQ